VTALIRHNKVATDAFRLSYGYAGLRDALASEDLRFQRYVASALLIHVTTF
jgi:hsp70-interacting protein